MKGNDKIKNKKKGFRQRNRDRARRWRNEQRYNRSRSRSPQHFSRSSPPCHSPFLRRDRSPIGHSNMSLMYHQSLDRSPNRISDRYSPSDLYDREIDSMYVQNSYIPYGDNELQRNPEHVPIFEPPMNREEWQHSQQTFGPSTSRMSRPWELEEIYSEDSQRRDFQDTYSDNWRPDTTVSNNWESSIRENFQDDNTRITNDATFVPRNETSTSWAANQAVQNFASPDEGHPMVPPFDGIKQDITSRKWIKIVDEIGMKENWTYQEKRFQMLSKFSGPAREWLLKEDVFAIESWGKLKRAFIHAFPSDMEFYTRLQRMMLRTKQIHETYSNYFTIKYSLLKSCNITGRKAISCLIGGLANDPLRNPAYNENFESIDSLYNFLVTSSEANKQKQQNIGPANRINNNEDRSTNCTVDQKHFIDLRVNGFPLQAYNDQLSQHVTIREEQAPCLRLVHNKKNTIIKGYMGKTITSIGDTIALIRIDNVTINMRVYIVPNFLQDMVLVLGDSLRNHPDIRYEEDSLGIPRFSHAKMSRNTSFSINEKLVRQMEEERIEPGNSNASSRFQNNNKFQRPDRLNEPFNPFGDQAARLLNR